MFRRFEYVRQFIDKHFWECVMVFWVVPFCFSAFSPHCFYLTSSVIVHLLASVSIFLSFPCVIFVMLLFCRVIVVDQPKTRILFNSFFVKDMLFMGILLPIGSSGDFGSFSVFLKKNIHFQLELAWTTMILLLLLSLTLEIGLKNKKNQ